MKKLKLKIDELKVQSFVTELNPELAHTAKGGEGENDGTIGIYCPGTMMPAEVSQVSKWPCRFACNHSSTTTTTAAPSSSAG